MDRYLGVNRQHPPTHIPVVRGLLVESTKADNNGCSCVPRIPRLFLTLELSHIAEFRSDPCTQLTELHLEIIPCKQKRLILVNPVKIHIVFFITRLSTYQTGKWNSAFYCSQLWLPIGSRSFLKCVHTLLLAVGCLPSLSRWGVNHPARKVCLGVEHKPVQYI